LAGPSGDGSDCVFVYGLLKRGFALNHHCAQGTYIGDATVRGALYSLGEYPGMVEGDGSVHGELYRFPDIALALEVLDEIEEYDPQNPENSLYVRVVKQAVLDKNATTMPAWVYLYNRDVKGLPRIKSGNWPE
jgi:gamma-glutamylcyclotransferase (GGCT)/AIG2-like uncharacterized protein YtfP